MIHEQTCDGTNVYLPTASILPSTQSTKDLATSNDKKFECKQCGKKCADVGNLLKNKRILPPRQSSLQQEKEYLRLHQEEENFIKEHTQQSKQDQAHIRKIRDRMRKISKHIDVEKLLTTLSASKEVFQQEKPNFLQKHPDVGQQKEAKSKMKKIQEQIAKKAGQGGRLRPKRYTNSTSMNGGESGRTLSGAESDVQLSKVKQGDDSTLLQATKVQ